MQKDKKEIFRAVKFLMFSISAGIIEIVSFTLLDLIPSLGYVLKAYVSLSLSVLWNFTLNRKFTFQSANNVPIAMLKTLGYYVVFAPLSIHLADMYLVQTLGWNEILVKFVTMLVNFVTEFIFQRLVVYGKSVDTNERAKAKGQAEEQNTNEKED
ncbi:MAG: GtrA family protein [Clostridia bacterium]|nr:GtrA family protein [Clostridia bacterium]